MRLPQPDWLAHRLIVDGPADALLTFRRAAAGSGMVAWWWDDDALAEDWFHLLLAGPHRSISAIGARLLANTMRDAVQQARDHAVENSQFKRCPFDLNALMPVPAALLRRGADDPSSLDWLWRHWGTTWPLRRVQVLVPELNADGTTNCRFVCSFHAADWTPWPALANLRSRFPSLDIRVIPLYGG